MAMHGAQVTDSRDRVVQRIGRLFWDRPLISTDLDEYPGWVVARVIHYGDLRDVRGLATVMGTRRFLETIAGLRTLSPKVDALWGAILKLEGIRCTRKRSRTPATTCWPP